LPLQPIDGPPKSGTMPMSGNVAPVVDDEPELPSAEPLPVELLEVLVELPPVEVDSPAPVSSGRVVVPGVAKPVEDPPGLLHPANPSEVTKARRREAIRAKCTAKPSGSQGRGEARPSRAPRRAGLMGASWAGSG
jgi:hypothetical protein